MVKYKLFFRDGNILKYNYYVECNMKAEPGIIEVNLERGTIDITKAAPYDGLDIFTIEDAKFIRDGINKICKENGEPELTEDELPLPEKDEEYYVYGSKAMNGIRDKINNNEIPENGTVAWY